MTVDAVIMVDVLAGERGMLTELAGDADRDAGGVRVERKREAAAGDGTVVERRWLCRRSGREESDWARGWAESAGTVGGRDCRVLEGRVMAAEAGCGRGWIGCGGWTSSGGCMGLFGGVSGVMFGLRAVFAGLLAVRVRLGRLFVCDLLKSTA
jgi:hypothetical protein